MVSQQDFEPIIKTKFPEARLQNIWQMEGGVSTSVWGLEIENAKGEVEKLILRQEAEKQSSAREFRLLKTLHGLGLPVPKVFYLDDSALIFPKPFLMMEFVEGKADFAPENLSSLLEQMLRTLFKIHAVSLTEHDFSYLPKYRERVLRRLEIPSQSTLESRIYELIKPFFSREPQDPEFLLHGDYWAGNLLWNDGKLLAVIDWEDAALGSPFADLASARLEILWVYGLEAMQSFTEGYQAKMQDLDFRDLPYWDLFAVLRPMNQISTWGLEAEKLAKMQKELVWFAEEAIQKLGM
jgi:aminoglycoside phosphotransferase (APT) family kinase protein